MLCRLQFFATQQPRQHLLPEGRVLGRPSTSSLGDSGSCAQALELFGNEIGIAFSGAEDVALVEYAHLTGRPYRVFRYGTSGDHSG